MTDIMESPSPLLTRQLRAYRVISAHYGSIIVPDDLNQILTETITDLMHLCDVEGENFEGIMRAARAGYIEDKGGE